MAKKFYRINHYIQSREVRVIDDEGKQIGVMLLEKALQQAQEKELDLIEVAPNAKPPVCKIVDFKKFKFLEAKKEQQEKKKAKKVNLKEVKLSPFIAD
ncbi:MAG TPA: translation initiation factor IF-3, partial [Patescibacteria group bacterium]|nr:translation initiation factor IF-3 [Patescibacteria group bacterium]